MIKNTILVSLIFSIGVCIGILYKEFSSFFHKDYMSVTIVDSFQECKATKILIHSEGQKISEDIQIDEISDKYTVNFFAEKGELSSYSIRIETEECGVLTGKDRQAYPGQVIYEELSKNGTNFHIRG